jgi:hypothetical protein
VRVQVRGTIPPGKRLVFGVATPDLLDSTSWILWVDGGLTTHPPTCLRARRIPAGVRVVSVPGSGSPATTTPAR